ncbi:hypothetical protein TEQG_04539 [Trichophyton equinum CBS 127.97]|uniref:Uncharacterized protein n=1 Tax=Trichophyton equinum (strain ATCC MYA-4606 / CBS 127.97) TaxID=559882 RepID=F2PUG2_TRIEC|nr:hypothetical protein TEQG_04539 [Trichophyton equinum CBS 127.97]
MRQTKLTESADSLKASTGEIWTDLGRCCGVSGRWGPGEWVAAPWPPRDNDQTKREAVMSRICVSLRSRRRVFSTETCPDSILRSLYCSDVSPVEAVDWGMEWKKKRRKSRRKKSMQVSSPASTTRLFTNKYPYFRPQQEGNTQETLLGDFVDPITASSCLQTWRWQAVSGFWPANVVRSTVRRERQASKEGQDENTKNRLPLKSKYMRNRRCVHVEYSTGISMGRQTDRLGFHVAIPVTPSSTSRPLGRGVRQVKLAGCTKILDACIDMQRLQRAAHLSASTGWAWGAEML